MAGSSSDSIEEKGFLVLLLGEVKSMTSYTIIGKMRETK